MQHTLRLMFAAMVAVALMHFNGVAAAQNAVKQIKLVVQCRNTMLWQDVGQVLDHRSQATRDLNITSSRVAYFRE